jgi:SAM-dependent methyltransferase
MNTKFITYLNLIRENEFRETFDKVNINTKSLSVLEIGSGTGYQLQLLKEKFKKAIGLDVEDSNYASIKTENVIFYDGINIPFENETFDVIFSSNTLEHVSEIDELEAELRRVLKPDGICIHILPSHFWRFWSTLTHYIALPRFVYQYLFSKEKKIYTTHLKMSFTDLVFAFFFPPRHGERGNRFTEIYYFRPAWWLNHFQKNNWHIKNCFSTGFFYTGNTIFGMKISFKNRKKMSKILGSSCYTYVLTKQLP